MIPDGAWRGHGGSRRAAAGTFGCRGQEKAPLGGVDHVGSTTRAKTDLATLSTNSRSGRVVPDFRLSEA